MSRTYPNLASFLKASHMTQEAFASEMEIAPSYVSMLLRGERTPSLAVALRIARRARVPLDSLLSPTSGDQVAS